MCQARCQNQERCTEKQLRSAIFFHIAVSLLFLGLAIFAFTNAKTCTIVGHNTTMISCGCPELNVEHQFLVKVSGSSTHTFCGVSRPTCYCSNKTITGLSRSCGPIRSGPNNQADEELNELQNLFISQDTFYCVHGDWGAGFDATMPGFGITWVVLSGLYLIVVFQFIYCFHRIRQRRIQVDASLMVLQNDGSDL